MVDSSSAPPPEPPLPSSEPVRTSSSDRERLIRRYNTPASLLAELRDAKAALEKKKFDPKQHDSEARREITKLFLKWYFTLIALAFVFCAFYNFIAARINLSLLKSISKLPPEHIVDKMTAIPYLEVSNTVALITTTLSSGVGFVIGYYFKNKEDNG